MRLKFKASECSCSVCADMCKNPCVPTPEEAQKLIQIGHRDNLVIWTSYGDVYTDVVRPKYTNTNNERACVYFDRITRKCNLHDSGLKPLEGRLARHNSGYSDLHEYVCSRWNSPLGKELIELINTDSEEKA